MKLNALAFHLFLFTCSPAFLLLCARQVTDDHLRTLVSFVMAEVDQQGTQQTSFILLKSIISRYVRSARTAAQIVICSFTR
eukprot:SAG31_NODE_206_length_20335_cov_17.910160_8_plen_81_part_00